jgi:hypothetical protein
VYINNIFNLTLNLFIISIFYAEESPLKLSNSIT